MGGPGLNDTFPNLKGSTQDTDDFDLYEYIGESWAVVFMHPGDFTPVCTTELGAAAHLMDMFEARGAKLCGYSCNDPAMHREWIQDIFHVTGGFVKFPIFCDPTRSHSVALGILDESTKDSRGLPLTIRSVFVLKLDKTVALMLSYPATIGRNFDEILRALEALQLVESNRVATPADWKRGRDCIVDYALSDADADATFGKYGYRVVAVPSERGKELDRHYERSIDIAKDVYQVIYARGFIVSLFLFSV